MDIRTLLNINVASKEELEEVLGLEPDLAQTIIDHRDLNGPFKSVDELRKINGLTEDMINAMMRNGITL